MVHCDDNPEHLLMDAQARQLAPLHFRGLTIPRILASDSFACIWKASQRKPVRLFWVNAHSINISESNSPFKQALNQAEFLLNDGAGVAMAGKVFGNPFPDNLNGTDWIPKFLDYLQLDSPGTTVYLLGAKENVLAAAAVNFKKKWQGLELSGTHHGYFDDKNVILDEINRIRPQVLIVGMGVPLQELFIDANWDRLQASGIRIAMAGGAVFDFLSGNVPRAPIWMRKLRLEWLFRLLQEPKRLASRYLLGNPYFCWLIFKEWLNKF